MSVFYRYLRPQKLNEKRCELTTLPHGGIALRLERLPEGDLFFTYARCHPDDYFSRDVARVIADDRATVAKSDARVLELLRHLPDTQNTDLLVTAIIRRCRQLDVSTAPPLVRLYMASEYAKLAEVLEGIHESNAVEQRRAEAWKRAISDMWQSTYKEQSK